MEQQRNKINIAIDGPAGAGKSTVARMVADALEYIYVDTGAMYRAVTWKALQQGLQPEETDKVAQMASDLQIRLIPGENGQNVIADGQDVTNLIRTPEVNNHVSQFAQIKEVREILTSRQMEMARQKGVVMDGRDIGSHVLPDAELKIFLTASVDERAERRYKEMIEANEAITLEQLKQDIARRDRTDEQRKVSPLVRADGAILLDSTNMSISQVAEHILELSRTIMGGAK